MPFVIFPFCASCKNISAKIIFEKLQTGTPGDVVATTMTTEHPRRTHRARGRWMQFKCHAALPSRTVCVCVCVCKDVIRISVEEAVLGEAPHGIKTNPSASCMCVCASLEGVVLCGSFVKGGVLGGWCLVLFGWCVQMMI